MTEDSLTERNRINQRNFRARRQNYVKDLEERLRKYENDGVQATIEIQTAARQVTDHNTKLRHLLISRFGMNELEIDAYLGANRSVAPFNNGLPTPHSTGLVSKPFPDHGNSNFQPNAPHSDHLIQPISTSSVLSPALGLASLHKLPDHDMSYPGMEHPNKKQKCNSTFNMSISTLTEPHALYQNSHNSHSPLPELEHDSLSESSNPQTPADQIDPMLRNTFKQSNKSNSRSINQNSYPSLQMSSILPMQNHNNTNLSHQQQYSVSTDTQQNRNLNQNPVPNLLHNIGLVDVQYPCNYQQQHQHSQQSSQQSEPIHSQIQPQQISNNDHHPSSSMKDLQSHQIIHHQPRNETSCEDAARIIASMRDPAGSITDPARTESSIFRELGCHINGNSHGNDNGNGNGNVNDDGESNHHHHINGNHMNGMNSINTMNMVGEKCRVGNLSLFQLMDRTG